jgi:hypothetical protein
VDDLETVAGFAILIGGMALIVWSLQRVAALV